MRPLRLLILQRIGGCDLNFCPTLGMQFVMLQECNLSRFRDPSKGVACAQTSVSVYTKFVVPSAVAALAVSLSKNCDESKEERARRLT